MDDCRCCRRSGYDPIGDNRDNWGNGSDSTCFSVFKYSVCILVVVYLVLLLILLAIAWLYRLLGCFIVDPYMTDNGRLPTL